MPKKVIKIQIEDEDAVGKVEKKEKPLKKEKKVTEKALSKSPIKKPKKIVVKKRPVSVVKTISKEEEVEEKRDEIKKEIEAFEVPKENVESDHLLHNQDHEKNQEVNDEGQESHAEKDTSFSKNIEITESSGDENKDPFTKSPVRKTIDVLNEDENNEMTKLKMAEINERNRDIDEVRPKSLRLYRNIAYFFIFLVIILLSGVLYFAFVKVTITIIPNQERISNNMIFDVYDKSKQGGESKDAVKGIVRKVPINYSIEYESTGTEVVGKEAVGEVKLINNYTKNQPLVATTRLLSSDNKLFRLKETVNVPAGGFVVAEIYADEPSPDMAIGPTKFTVPGLWAGLQDQIYAESEDDIIYRQKVKKYIVEMDIENGVRDLKQQLLSQAKSEINKTYEEYGQIIYKIDENSIVNKVDGKKGDEVDKFSITMDADVIVVAFDESKASDLAKNKFVSSLTKNKELITFDEENIIYSLNNYDYLNGDATINATFEGKVSLKEDSSVVDKDKILGLKNEELNAYLSELPDIAGYEVKYYPSFIKIVPKLSDRIEIKIKK